jgi:uncharacterized SAM-binding protein YcdF (DUF218 family)
MGMTAGRRRWKWVIGLAVGAIMVGAYVLSPRLLYVEHGVASADVIIVLGGDAEGRVWRGLELYKEDVAPTILLSGAGDGGLPRRRLELAGVDSGVIVEEDRSRNTRENAEYSVAWMREQGFESAVIVTSWWHSRRALACFRKFGPDMEWSSVPSYPGVSMDGKPSVQEAVFILQEYVKVALYPVLHGVWAWQR